LEKEKVFLINLNIQVKYLWRKIKDMTSGTKIAYLNNPQLKNDLYTFPFSVKYSAFYF